MSQERIDYAFRHIYDDAIRNPQKKDEESIKNTIMYYLIDLADHQREEDISVIHDAFNKWGNTKESSNGLDSVIDRIINMIRNEIVTSFKEVGENYQALIKKTFK